MTIYVVLQSLGDNWVVADGYAAGVEAHSAEAAIRKAVEAPNNGDGIYVAVPQASWKPVRVSVEQTTRVKFDTEKPA